MTARLLRVFESLLQQYGPLHWWPADSPFEVVIGAILTQNTAWSNVEKAIANLRRENCLTPARLRQTTRKQLEEWIRPAGFFRQKAERLQLFADYLGTQHQDDLAAMLKGPLPEVRRRLLAMKGVGPETADSILLYAADRPSFVIDAYTRRLFGRLQLLDSAAPYEQIRSQFMDRLPADSDLFNEYHALIVEHCKRHCRKRQPRCGDCCLGRDCPNAER
ncbi:MAG: endonuclease III domain-containing protein [Desulfuromonadaceae bacterium]